VGLYLSSLALAHYLGNYSSYNGTLRKPTEIAGSINWSLSPSEAGLISAFMDSEK
jgi:hypothetical protein